jgi:hypothetical protein
MSATVRQLHALASSPSERRRLLIVEQEASPLPGDDSADFDETLAIAQLRGELPVAFAQRTLQRLALAERSGRRFGSAMILAGRRNDAEQLAARRLIAEGLAIHGRGHSGTFELSLEAEADASAQARAALLQLAGELTVRAAPGSVAVRLRFGRPSAAPAEVKSGTWTKPTEASA